MLEGLPIETLGHYLLEKVRVSVAKILIHRVGNSVAWHAWTKPLFCWRREEKMMLVKKKLTRNGLAIVGKDIAVTGATEFIALEDPPKNTDAVPN